MEKNETKTPEIKIKNGKLFSGGKYIQPEIGNAEHIKVLKRHDEYVSDLKKGYVLLDIQYASGSCGDTIFVEFPCVCGDNLQRSTHQDIMDSEFVALMLKSPKEKCPSCNREYKFFASGWECLNYGICIKLLK